MINLTYYKDAGFQGRLRSLAGVYGKAGLGSKTGVGFGTTMASPGEVILAANPHRCYCVIKNVGTFDCVIGLGQGNSFTLSPGDGYQVDQLTPWTGQIWAMSSAAGDTTLAVFENQLQGT